MSDHDKDFFQSIREEIKSTTSKMVQQSEPPPELVPLENDQWLTGPVATDPNEVDPGFEFVELVAKSEKANPQVNKENKKATGKAEKDAKKAAAAAGKKQSQQKEPPPPPAAKKSEKAKPAKQKAATETAKGKDPKKLKHEIASKLKTVKEKLQKKKAECHALDGIPEDAVDVGHRSVDSDDDDYISINSSEISKDSKKKSKNAGKKKGLNDDPPLQRQYEEKTAVMKLQIKEIQNKLQNMRVTGHSENGAAGKQSKFDQNKKHAPMKKADSTSTLSSGSDARHAGAKFGKNFAPGPVSDHHQHHLHVPPAVLKPENLLLLTLFTLDPKQRDDYLMKIGKERALLVSAKPQGEQKAKTVHINTKYKAIAQELKREALFQCYGPQMRKANVGDVTKPFVTVQQLQDSAQEAKKVREIRTFEEEVTYLLNNGKTTDKKDYKKELTLENVSKAEKNGFLKEPNIAALAELVERLVKADVGYIVEGVLRVNGNNNAQAFVDDHTREANVYIRSVLMRKCAMDGDYVRVFVKHGDAQDGAGSGEGSGPEKSTDEKDETAAAAEEPERMRNNWGFVVEILEKRHSRICVGSFLPYKENTQSYIKFAPRDSKIPFMRVYKQNWPEAVFKNDFKEIESVIYQAEIIEWHNDIPVGNILKSIGKCGELEVENHAILVEYDLDVSPYSENILNSLPATPFQIPEEELAKREDLRDECVFTIDPLTARDLDDALSCKILKNGNFEIGVHISDVSYFLKEGSELDELVKLKATSIYMVDNVYHMLPKPLCFLCSLLPGEDKLAFSVFWEITPDAKVLKTRFAKTVINSCTQLAYEHAQIMLDRPNEDLNSEDFPQILHDYSPNYISRIVNQLQTIAKQLRERRMQNGCLKINQPKLTYKLDPNTGKPTAYAPYELRPANQMIEDFMLLANASVAEHTHSKFSEKSILRNHFAPSEAQMKVLAKQLAMHGHNFEVGSSKKIAESVESIVNSAPHPDAARAAINIMIAKPMTRARYFCSAFASEEEEFYHYALAIPMYTHFTSPIRRYADCMVHRVLGAALEVHDPPTRSPDELSKLTGICNIKKYNSKLAGDASSLLYFKHYLQQAKSITTEAAVLDIGPQQLELVLIETGHAIKVTYKQLSKELDCKITDTKPIRHCVLIPKDKKIPSFSLVLFSKVRVTVYLSKNALTVRGVLPIDAAVESVTVAAAAAAAATTTSTSDTDKLDSSKSNDGDDRE